MPESVTIEILNKANRDHRKKRHSEELNQRQAALVDNIRKGLELGL